jgi:hypothetical protein
MMGRSNPLAVAFLATAIFLLFTACSTADRYVKEVENDDSSFVFGYIDMEDSPTHLKNFSVRQVLPKKQRSKWNFRTYDGAFYMENVPPGSYQLANFGGPGGLSIGGCVITGGRGGVSYYTFVFPRQSGGFRLEKPGIYFIGSYKYKETGDFFDTKFDVEEIKSPTEREVLEKILPYCKGTGWEKRLQERLEELSR